MIDAKVIVIDDNAAVLKTMGMVLKGAFTKVVTVEDPQLIPALIVAGDVDAVVLEDHARNPILHGISLLSDYVLSRAFAASVVFAILLGGGYFLYCYLGLSARPRRGKYTRRR